MRRPPWIVAVAALLLASNAGAAPTWVGPQFAFPLVAHDVGSDHLGVDAGATLDAMPSSYFGVGADVAFHYWPASRAYKDAFDHYLRTTWYQALDSPTWAFTALQVTPHVKLVAPFARGPRPWVRLGLGVYGVDRNLGDPNWDQSYRRLVEPRWTNYGAAFGWNAAVGFDVRVRPGSVIGLEVTYHHLAAERDKVPDFSALSLGTHVLFGPSRPRK